MSRSNYSRLGGRRSGSGRWLWVVWGMLLGFACSALLFFAAIIAGVLNVDTSGTGIANRLTPAVTVVTATTDPLQPTNAPLIITATAPPASPTIEIQGGGVVAPTPTSPPPTNALPSGAAATPTTLSIPTLPVSTNNPGAVPDALSAIVTRLIRVDGGTFQMGTTPDEILRAVNDCQKRDDATCDVSNGEDSQPVHSVTVDAFQIEQTEVTYDQYITFLNWKRHSSGGSWSHKNGCDGQPCVATKNDAGGENSNIIFDSANYDVNPIIKTLPVVNVTWYGAKSYCEAIGRRLPTEAEWERAARGTDNRIYPWGNDWDPTRAKTSRPKDAPKGPVGVGSLVGGISPYGAYDMAGNVAEWVGDWYQANFYNQPEATQPNPKGPPAGTTRVVRGGSWDAVPFFSRSVSRQDKAPNDQAAWIGFRCAADANAPGTTGGNLVASPNPATLGTDTSGEESTSNTDGAAPTLPAAPPTTAPSAPNNTTPTAVPPAG